MQRYAINLYIKGEMYYGNNYKKGKLIPNKGILRIWYGRKADNSVNDMEAR